ncbi:erythroid membrane-associated protein-like isoform X2 [Polypterus senegalus]|uniref:erythroid membrane-associated protein-like isoform X2 n=1 Tax=Polypterus senegalus TaxID=55291 RepID=UPI0019632363|nr:erythroid membrane-associated protein-like isoform X2 [Polypterus senegalus]
MSISTSMDVLKIFPFNLMEDLVILPLMFITCCWEQRKGIFIVLLTSQIRVCNGDQNNLDPDGSLNTAERLFVCAFVMALICLLIFIYLLCRECQSKQGEKTRVDSPGSQPLIQNSELKEVLSKPDHNCTKSLKLQEDYKCTKCLNLQEELFKIVNEVEEKGIILNSVWDSYLENKADISLPEAEHLDILQSADSLHVRLSQNTQGQDNWPCITGTALSPGRSHYWEVEVGEKSSWAIGVASESKRESKCIPDTPEGGFWIIRLCKGKSLEAVSNKVIKLQKEKPRKVGVYRNGNYVSFYNTEVKQRIQRFEIKQSQTLYPVFSPGLHDRGPLIIKKRV